MFVTSLRRFWWRHRATFEKWRRTHKLDIWQVAQSFTELNWRLPKHLYLGKPAANLSLALEQVFPRFSHLNHSDSHKSISPHFGIGGFFRNKMAAIRLGLPSMQFWQRKFWSSVLSLREQCFYVCYLFQRKDRRYKVQLLPAVRSVRKNCRWCNQLDKV